ncbi:peptidoglycan DD-metalloendopeptidase family protein [Dactylosporangium sp. AC04546]|uniref:peptidoglycan DD-metalloendopeptidase family protein n=1 Tax=Dactylosporangium sp. AC04546 TaxID=2862460 RepID=UPI001EDCD225|nr:peptidoglycan DD-metalloendopeptidase family protein [Dactylosporangium sp. AC04546]WVK80434.1 peptidoglycan DD-metalloendopeptidase family protein [Dactylosporangium sp. AC04546]
MSDASTHSTTALAAGTALAAVLAVLVGLVGFVASGAVALATSPALAEAAPSAQLNVEAIPPHARHLVPWVIRAGTSCPQLTPPMIAAQIDLESSWNAEAIAHNPPARGGDAIGIAQFQLGTWATWGDDYDRDGRGVPEDPEDAIFAMGRLMCDLVTWAGENRAAGRLRGDVLDLAWAAYFCGRGCVLSATGTVSDYPRQVRARIGEYTLATADAWRLPLPAGSYELVSRFRSPNRPNHDGVDLAAPTGTPIYAAAAGVVLDAGCTSRYCDRPGNEDLPGCGLRINIDHRNGIATRYCHAVRLNVAVGTHVEAGQVIAWVGSTGHSSGPHLHFEVHRGAPPLRSENAIDPLTLMDSVGVHIRRDPR